MVSKIGVLAGGVILGMMVLVSCEPLYQNLKEKKDECLKKVSKAKTKAETSLADVKQKVTKKTDDALDIIDEKIDDLISSVNSLDISKVKGKSKMALEAMKQKIMTLKQD